VRYLLNRAAVYDAATACCTSGRVTTATGGFLTRQDAERAFAEWAGEFVWAGVSMCLTRAANGEIAAEFTAEQRRAA
jgi:hypothetical protein